MKKYSRLLFMFILLSALSACGTQDETVGVSGEEYGQEEYLQGEYVYVPEFYAFEQPDNINSSEIKIKGDRLYQYNYLYDLEAGKGTDQFRILSLEGDVLLEIVIGGNGSESQYSSEHLRAYDVDAEGDVYTVEAASGESIDGGWVTDYYLCCYDASGSKVLSRDITAALKKDEDNLSASQLLLDEEGRIYIMCGSTVKLFERDGSPSGSISVVQKGSLHALTKGVSGDIYVFYSDWLSADNSMQGARLDFETGNPAEEFGNLPDGGRSFCPGDKKDFLINTGSKVYEYDIETQSYEEVFTWLDCDIMESNVRGIDRTEEGALFAVTGDWSGGIMEVAFLRRVNISEVQTRTEIVLGLLYNDSNVQAAAVDFNKTNNEYRVVIRTYADRNAGESYDDGLTRLNIDITTGDSPDILDLSQLNIESLTRSGAMEDLTPYLENSNVLDRDDYLENVLAGYTYDNKLAAIPNSFSVETMAGKSSELGEKKGWTLEEVLAYAKEHPEAKLFYGADESSSMEFCMSANVDLFLDWESGEVKFDSEIFMELLEYLKIYKENVSSKPDDREPPELLQSGDCLLYPCRLDYFNDIQLFPAMFDQPVTYVGYPTAGGSANAVMRCDKLYGISAASGNKEGAWTFIEHCLAEPAEWAFSPRRSQLEVQIEEAKEAARNSNGETLFDEDGNPLPAHGEKGVRFGFSGWEYTYHACTDEEIDQVKELLAVAKPVKDSDSLVMAIIEEEVQAFYAGQKSAEDVAKIIQSRVQLYVDETR